MSAFGRSMDPSLCQLINKIYLIIYLSIYTFIYLSIHLSIYLFIYLYSYLHYIYESIYITGVAFCILPVIWPLTVQEQDPGPTTHFTQQQHLSIHPSMYLSTYLYIKYLYVCQPIYISICLSSYLYVYIYVCLPTIYLGVAVRIWPVTGPLPVHEWESGTLAQSTQQQHIYSSILYLSIYLSAYLYI